MWQVTVVGSGQDAGVPQVGCSCKQCAAARENPSLERLGPSLLAKNEDPRKAILFDASPDIRQQLDRFLPPMDLGCIDSVFITHYHVGHYWGLPLLGKEGPDMRDVTVYAPPGTVSLLASTPAVARMESRGNIRLKPCDPGQPIHIDDLTIECFYVPHRQDAGDTAGFLVRGQSKSLIYIPDVDEWTPETVERIYSADIALLDGTFFSASELGPFREQSEVPHPPIQKSLDLFKHRNQAIYYTHLNHTNPAGLEGPEREAIRKAGADVAFDGMTVKI